MNVKDTSGLTMSEHHLTLTTEQADALRAILRHFAEEMLQHDALGAMPDSDRWARYYAEQASILEQMLN